MKQLVINWHLLEACNFNCGYCYAHWIPNGDEIWRTPAKWKRLLEQLLKTAGVVPGSYADKIRLNIAGGEPMLLEKQGKGVLSNILSHAASLGFDLSIITNGSLVSDDFLHRWCGQFHTIGISVDSGDAEVNEAIGRCSKSSSREQIAPSRVADIFNIARSCNPRIVCKINTVVCSYNWQEYLAPAIVAAAPDRWKIFKMLPIADSQVIAQKQAPFVITNEEFQYFVQRNQLPAECGCEVVSEDNDEMTASYIMVNPFGQFYSNTHGVDSSHVVSGKIHEIGAKKAYAQIDALQPLNQAHYNKRYFPIQNSIH